jgi:hypothetical protein
VSRGELLTEFEFSSGAQRGARLSLYSDRVVLHGAEAMEAVPLAHLASVRVAFERDAHKVNWAVGLSLVALALALIAGPLQAWMHGLAAKVSAGGGNESLESLLLATFNALAALARLFAPAALLMFAGAAALILFFWLGQTRLTLSFAATERAFPVRGRNRLLFQFAEAVADQLAAPGGKKEA